MAKLIRYKNVDFDFFEVWIGEREYCEGEDVDLTNADSMTSQVCPWCIKKYELYKETDRTPESVNKELESYEGYNPESFDDTCGILGCNNGAADQDFAVSWKDCEVIA